MGRKCRHFRDESDPLLGFYRQTLEATSSIRNHSNPLYTGGSSPPVFSSKKKSKLDDDDDSFPISPLKGTSSPPDGEDDLHKSIQKSFLGNYRTDVDTNSLHSDSERKTKKSPKKQRYRVHRVSYTAQDHIQVLFRLYGSAFPNVFPFVLINVFWTFLVHFLKSNDVVDWTFHSSVGHSFMGLLVSFLIVSRSQISYTRFMEYRKLLAKSYRACREIAQHATIYTMYTRTPSARQWRQEVCYQTILMLRITMDALLWSSTERESWEDEYYRYIIDKDSQKGRNTRRYVDISSYPLDSVSDENGDEESQGKHRRRPSQNYGRGRSSVGEDDNVSEHFFRFRNLTHGRRSNVDENFRAPITFMHCLRSKIMEHPQYLGYKMAVNEYRDLLMFVTHFDESFHGYRVLVFTPYPFPLVQMTRFFLLCWVFTLPLVLLVDYRLWSSLLIVILVTFGFVGIEYVSMALDDPFGDDTNDIDEHGMALLVYEDIYLALYRTDGPEAACQLRERVLGRYKKGRSLDCYRDDLKGYEIWDALPHRHHHHNPNALDWSRNPPPQVAPPQAPVTPKPMPPNLHQQFPPEQMQSPAPGRPPIPPPHNRFGKQ